MRIGMLTQWFDPETGPASLPGTYAREFVAKGHQVRVLTGYPNYPEGRIYPGYRQRIRRTSAQDGYRVTRIPLFPDHSASAIGRIANYGSFASSAATLGLGALRGAEGIWVYNSPATVTIPLMTESRFGAVPYFLHVQDLWPDSLVHSGMMPGGKVGDLATYAISKLIRVAERRATVVGVISPTVRELILERDPGLDPDRIVYAPNPTDETLFRPLREVRIDCGIAPDPDYFTLTYAGAVGEVQGLSTMLDAARLLLDEPRIRIRVVGDGIARERLEARVEDEKLSNVEFLGRVRQSDVPFIMAQSDAQLVSLADSEFLRYTTPSKIPSLLASETPIVGQIAGDGANLISQSGSGYVTPPGDAVALAVTISQMASITQSERDALGRSGREFYLRNFSVSRVSDIVIKSLGGN